MAKKKLLFAAFVVGSLAALLLFKLFQADRSGKARRPRANDDHVEFHAFAFDRGVIKHVLFHSSCVFARMPKPAQEIHVARLQGMSRKVAGLSSLLPLHSKSLPKSRRRWSPLVTFA